LSKLPKSLAAIIGSSINRYLALDPGAQESVAALQNRTISLKLKEFSFPLFFHIDNKSIKVLPELVDAADVSLVTSLPNLIQMTLGDDGDESILGSGIEMSGDMEVGRQFRNIFKNIDIDWEELVSKYTGDVIAHKLGNSYRQFGRWFANTRQSIQQDISEYLQEESRQLPSAIEVQEYINAVGDIRLAVERAEARLKMLTRHNGSLTSESSTEKER